MKLGSKLLLVLFPLFVSHGTLVSAQWKTSDYWDSHPMDYSVGGTVGDRRLPFFERLNESGKKAILEEWNFFFDGTPTGAFNQFHLGEEIPIETWIRGYQSCRLGIDTIYESLKNYDTYFRDGRLLESQNEYQIVLDVLKQSDDCQQAHWTAYLSATLLMGPVGVINKRSTLAQDGRYEMALYTIFLGNFGKLKALTPALREELSNNGEAPLWLKKEEGSYYLTAFYDCLNSTIYIDSEMMPFNLAASLFHELDHFYRDKEGGHFFFTDDRQQDKSMKSYLARDELFATVGGAYYQRRMLEMEPKDTGDYSHRGNEFNLFQPDGPLDKATQYLSDVQEQAFGTPKRYHRNADEFLTFLGRISESPYQDYDVDVARQFFCDLKKIVMQGYFNESETDCNDDSWHFDSRFTLGNKLLFVSLYRAHIDYDQYIKTYVKQFKALMEVFSYDWLRFQQPSEICNKVVEAQENGELENYLGTKLMKGGRGGNGGVRPILPCVRVKF